MFAGTSLTTLLALLFIALKLLHQITWSWFWVLSPLYPAILFWVVMLMIAILAFRN